MGANIKILQSDSVDSWFNLAIEDWIFQEMESYDHILFLWRNAEAVVIGRSQNPWLECNLDRMSQDNIQLARRQSGGGAVFHDLGNLNFTFLSRKPHYRRRDNFDIIINALRKFHIDAEVSGRNDIVIKDENGGEQKISGNAFKENVDRAFHHGTLLIKSDLARLQNYLNPNKRKMIAKGIKSVRSRVINLCELNNSISVDDVKTTLIEEFCAFHGVGQERLPLIKLKKENLDHLIGLNLFYKKMQDWDWLYGQTLNFTHRFEERLSFGSIDVQLEVARGIMHDARIYSDSLYPELIDAMQTNLIGFKYQSAVISSRLEEVKHRFPALYEEVEEFKRWLLDAL